MPPVIDRGVGASFVADYRRNLETLERANSCCNCSHRSVGAIVMEVYDYDQELGRALYDFWAVDWVKPADMKLLRLLPR